MVIFEGRVLGMNKTAHQIRICKPYDVKWRSLGRLVITSPTVQTDIGPTHEDHPHFEDLSLHLCKLVFFTVFSKIDPYF